MTKTTIILTPRRCGKSEYVRLQSQKQQLEVMVVPERLPAHTCHWPGCGKKVPPAMWGCKPHWFKLPSRIRVRIWQTYKPGQEVSKTPSVEYIAAAKEAQQWIRENAG